MIFYIYQYFKDAIEIIANLYGILQLYLFFFRKTHKNVKSVTQKYKEKA